MINQLIDHYEPLQRYSDEPRREHLKLHINGSSFRVIEQDKGIHHLTGIGWSKQVGEQRPDRSDPETIPKVGDLDELKPLLRLKKHNLVMDSHRSLQS